MAKRMRFILSTIMVIVAMTAKAQVTTSSLSGKVTDPDKEAIIGATVQAIHEPSGTRYGAITNIDGRYTIQGMRAGGPYSVEVSYIGYQTMMYKDVTLQLGEVYNLNVQMKESSELLEEVVVTAQKTKFASEKTGATTNISNTQIASMPSVSRSITDYSRLSAYGGNGMSFALETSSACDGPLITDISACGISSLYTCERRKSVPSSSPFDIFTIFCPSLTCGESCFAVVLVAGDGAAVIISSAPSVHSAIS